MECNNPRISPSLADVKLTFLKKKIRNCMECPKSVKILDKQLLKCCQVMSKETYRMMKPMKGMR